MKHMKAIVLYLLLTCLAVVAYAQPYPGGISADLEAWYDASALSLSNNDPVASWTDMSGNGYNSTQANAANRPIFVENVINGQPVVRFDGSNDYLQTVLASAIPQPITVFIVLKLPSNNATIQNVFDGLGTNRLQFNKQAGNDTFRAFAGTIDDFTSAGYAGDFTTVTLVFDGANSETWFDGVSVNTGNAGTNSLGTFNIGARQDYLMPLNGDIAEFIVYSDALDAAERDAVEDYLYDKFFNPVLPVELSSFSAVLTVENYVSIKWITQTETGVSGYYIYRSQDNNFANAIRISDMIIAENSSNQQTYQYVDTELIEDGKYYYWLNVQDMDGSEANHGPTSVNFNITGHGAHGAPELLPTPGISSIYPNPIMPSTVISYNITKAVDVRFKVYNSRGQLINSFDEGFKDVGSFRLGWDGRDSSGRQSPNGIYFVKMQAGRDTSIRKTLIIK